MTRSSSAAIPNYAQACAWFVELVRALERHDREREGYARRRLRDLGVTVRFGAAAEGARHE